MHGTLLKKEYYDLSDKDNIKNLTFAIVIYTDLINNQKVGCVTLGTTYVQNLSNIKTYIGFMDSDEISSCLKALNYIKENVITNTAEANTDCTFKTRDKLCVGFSSMAGKDWITVVQIDSFSPNSLLRLKKDDLDKIISKLNEAKSFIEEKTK